MFLYTSCDTEDSNPTGTGGNIVGTWVLTSVTLSDGINDPETVDPSQLYMSMTFTFNEDGTYSGTQSGWNAPASSSGTWSTDGGTLTLNDSVEGTDSVPYSVDGNQMTITYQEYEPDQTLMTYDLTFTKQ